MVIIVQTGIKVATSSAVCFFVENLTVKIINGIKRFWGIQIVLTVQLLTK